MRLAFSVGEIDRNAPLGAPFGRCKAYVIVDTVAGVRHVLPNPAEARDEGAGKVAAEFIARQNVHAVISGRFGSKAWRVLTDAEVTMCRATSGTISEFLGQGGSDREGM
jgi:predicted Fe-Mo cluster-binding NifX family protein